MTLDARIGNRLFRAKRNSAETAGSRDGGTPEDGTRRRIGRARVLWAWLRRRRGLAPWVAEEGWASGTAEPDGAPCPAQL